MHDVIINQTKLGISVQTYFLLTRLFLLSVNFLFSQPLAAQSEEKNSSAQAEKQAKQSKNKSSPTKASIAMPIALIKQQKKDLQHYIGQEKVTPVLAGATDYLTIVNKYTSANSKGVAILLPDWHQGATNPKAINFLRKSLPDEGWTTIAIQPDNKPYNYPSMATTLTEQQKENKSLIDAYQTKLSALMTSVMKTTRKYPGIVIVIAQGNNAALLVDLYHQGHNKPANALLMLSSFRQSNIAFNASVNVSFAQQVAVSEYPVLDLYLKNDHPLTRNYAKKRRSLAKQEMKVYFRQRQLNNTASGYYPERELLTQINAWLRAIGW